MNAAQYLVVFALRVYRVIVSPLLSGIFGPLGFGCRFRPTCSQYALEAVRAHGAARGLLLSLRRLSRCHPWGGQGEDPVPPGKNSNCERKHSWTLADGVVQTGSTPGRIIDSPSHGS